MKVRMLTSIAGHAMPHYGIPRTFSLAPGDELELHEELAGKWIGSGIAVAAEAAQAPIAARKTVKKAKE